MSSAQPPPALVEPFERVLHGRTVLDPYSWLRDRERPEVVAYLEAENRYTDQVMLERTGDLRERLVREIRGRIKEADQTVATHDGGYWYYSRIEEGQEYWIHCRRKGSMEAPEQVLLDENLLAAVDDYVAVDGWAISPDHRVLAYAVDTSGDERYDVIFRDLEADELLPDRLVDVGASLAWANDSQTLFYDLQDDAHRPHRLMRHLLGTAPDTDVEVFHEADERFFIGVSRTKSDAFLVLSCSSHVTSEEWVLDADDPLGDFRLIAPRRQDVEYSLAHHRCGSVDRFLLLTNDGAPNFKLVECGIENTQPEHWRDVISHRDDVLLEDLECFANHLVIDERTNGLVRVRVMDLRSSSDHYIDFPEPTYSVYGASNPEYASTVLRYGYSSLVTPHSVFAYDMDTRTRERLKQQEVVGGHTPSEYTSERIWAESHDGTRVPISLVWRGERPTEGSRPVLLYAYGAYGMTMDASFSRARLSLLERGIVFAIAHVRGGGELGRAWYEAGKLAHKQNTFLDFIACAEHLIREGFTRAERLAGMGGSAGGLLVGAVANLRPDLFRALVADVPFVDVLNTLLDPSLPLTVIEWEEWGNPAEPEAYADIAAYAPYENVGAHAYPNLLVTAGLNDPRVGYWEPAKWVAKLRATKTDDAVLLLHTNLGAGHGGASGRFEYLKEIALEYAFVLERLRAASPPGPSRSPFLQDRSSP